MQLDKFALYARKIHRILVIFITILGTIMMITGLMIDELEEGNNIIADPEFIRSIHGKTSTPFAIILGLMIITGLILYLYPWLQKTIRKSTPPPTQTIN
jgi:hypothetical protein